MFVSFEGGDGSGKSTQAKLLVESLRTQGLDVIHTREPGGSTGAEEIRGLILSGEPDRWSPETELLLFNAARRDHLEKTIIPALERGAIVVSDRFADSTRVYQGVTRGDLRGLVDSLHTLMIGKEPDLTIVMKMPADEALRRGMSRNTTALESEGVDEGRFELFGLDFQKKLTAGFDALTDEFPDRCVGVDASGSIEEVAERVMTAYLNHEAARLSQMTP
ncbi:MAG: dTMP kinase [Roseibium sp.]|uniref:dTMP kinase n=1 Tax=Roseibium sp. TaxID=1936156 RepID=UPI003296EEC7